MMLFTGLVSRGEGNWIVEVQDLPDGKSVTALGATWKKAKAAAQEGVEVSLKQPPNSVNVMLKFKDPELAGLVDKVRWQQVVARDAQNELNEVLGHALRRLTQHATFRDVGDMLGYSPQYIGKLAPRGSGEPSS